MVINKRLLLKTNTRLYFGLPHLKVKLNERVLIIYVILKYKRINNIIL